MKKPFFLITIVIGLLIQLPLSSAPYFGQRFNFEQPDGRLVPVNVYGDEFFQRVESIDGYTLIRDPKTQWIEYAKLSAAGTHFDPSGIRYTGLTQSPSKTQLMAPGTTTPISKGIRLPASAIEEIVKTNQKKLGVTTQTFHQLRLQRGTSPLQQKSNYAYAAGNVIGLTIIIHFPGEPQVVNATEITNFLNQTGYSGNGNNGSIKDFFYTVSGGAITYTNIVKEYTAKNPKSYYDTTVKNRVSELIHEALTAIDAAGFNYSQLTTNATNIIYGLNLLYDGSPTQGWGNGLWPHQGTLSPTFSADGVQTGKYQITNIGSSLTIGTFCHENGHLLFDWPDLYDYGGDSHGVGMFCLMGGGNYGGSGKNPIPPNPYYRHSAGWVTPTPLIAKTTPYSITSNALTSYRYTNDYNNNEAFYIESIVKTGRYASYPDDGLIIWHVDENGNNNNQQRTLTQHYLVSVEQADGLYSLELNQNNGGSGDLFHAGYKSTFGQTTQPNSNWWDGSASQLLLKNISAIGPTMTFETGPPVSPNIITVWQWVANPHSTPHPYPHNYTFTRTFNAPTANEIKLSFTNFNTEYRYDLAKLIDKNGTVKTAYSGNKGSLTTSPVVGNSLTILFKSDGSINNHGFDISGYWTGQYYGIKSLTQTTTNNIHVELYHPSITNLPATTNLTINLINTTTNAIAGTRTLTGSTIQSTQTFKITDLSITTANLSANGSYRIQAQFSHHLGTSTQTLTPLKSLNTINGIQSISQSSTDNHRFTIQLYSDNFATLPSTSQLSVQVINTVTNQIVAQKTYPQSALQSSINVHINDLSLQPAVAINTTQPHKLNAIFTHQLSPSIVALTPSNAIKPFGVGSVTQQLSNANQFTIGLIYPSFSALNSTANLNVQVINTQSNQVYSQKKYSKPTLSEAMLIDLNTFTTIATPNGGAHHLVVSFTSNVGTDTVTVTPSQSILINQIQQNGISHFQQLSTDDHQFDLHLLHHNFAQIPAQAFVKIQLIHNQTQTLISEKLFPHASIKSKMSFHINDLQYQTQSYITDSDAYKLRAIFSHELGASALEFNPPIAIKAIGINKIIQSSTNADIFQIYLINPTLTASNSTANLVVQLLYASSGQIAAQKTYPASKLATIMTIDIRDFDLKMQPANQPNKSTYPASSIYTINAQFTHPFGISTITNFAPPTTPPSLPSTLTVGTILNGPNPFNPYKTQTVFQYILTQPASVDVEIYSLSGRRVFRTSITYGAAGGTTGLNSAIQWDGRDESGQWVSNGVYIALFKFTSQDTVIKRKTKVVVIK